MSSSRPKTPESAPVMQEFGSLADVRIGLDREVRHKSVAALNRRVKERFDPAGRFPALPLSTVEA